MEGSFTEEKANTRGRFHVEGGTWGDAAHWNPPAGPAAAQGPGLWGHIHLLEGLGLAGVTGTVQVQVWLCKTWWTHGLRWTQNTRLRMHLHTLNCLSVNQQCDSRRRMALQVSTSPSVKWENGGKMFLKSFVVMLSYIHCMLQTPEIRFLCFLNSLFLV